MFLLTATAHLMTVTAQGGGGSTRSPVKLVCHGSVADLKTFRKFVQALVCFDSSTRYACAVVGLFC